MTKKGFPLVHFYDQDFVDIYDRTWAWIQDFWHKGTEKNGLQPRYFSYPDSKNISQFDILIFKAKTLVRQFANTPTRVKATIKKRILKK